MTLSYTASTSLPEVSIGVEKSQVLDTFISQGRPDLSNLLNRVIANTGVGGVGVGACGPSGLVDGVEKLVRAVSREEQKRVGGVELHSERFSL
jgi:ferric-chelate reductase